MNVFLLEHGELFASGMDDVPGRAQPDRVDLGLLVDVDESLLQVRHLEAEVLKNNFFENVLLILNNRTPCKYLNSKYQTN